MDRPSLRSGPVAPPSGPSHRTTESVVTLLSRAIHPVPTLPPYMCQGRYEIIRCRTARSSTSRARPAPNTARSKQPRSAVMPIASPDVYAEMLDRAKAGAFAYPAINISSSQTLNAALRGFAEAESDGIVQVSTGGAEYLSGPTVKDMVTGASALAAYAHEVARKYPVNIALHTDHCPKDKLDKYVRPLLAISKERVSKGGEPLFQSHMWDGSAVPLAENLDIA